MTQPSAEYKAIADAYMAKVEQLKTDLEKLTNLSTEIAADPVTVVLSTLLGLIYQGDLDLQIELAHAAAQISLGILGKKEQPAVCTYQRIVEA